MPLRAPLNQEQLHKTVNFGGRTRGMVAAITFIIQS